jgi:oxaloacetate decarboxylase alpha subunit
MAANGIAEIRLSDPSNSARYWKEIAAAATAAGLKTVINLIFSISPRHSESYYAEKTREAARVAPYRICFKDPSGLLTPEQTRKLVPVILSNSGTIPVELHTHCNTGLGPLCCLEAAQLGIRSLNSAVPPLANASSNPSLFNLTGNLRAMNYEPVVHEQKLFAVSKHFERVARREKFPIGAPLEYDASHVTHQVPGGMISNFRYQLGRAGMEHRLPEVLEETARVRADLGYPIMVTPYSQFVGVQATTNVILGERYREVSDEVIQYALGFWGEDEASAVRPDIKDRILDRPRAKELSTWTPPQITVRRVREQLGGPGVSDDELLLRYFSSQTDVEAMKAAGQAAPYGRNGNGLMNLIETVTKQGTRRQIYIRTHQWSLRLEKR